MRFNPSKELTAVLTNGQVELVEARQASFNPSKELTAVLTQQQQGLTIAPSALVSIPLRS